MRHHAFGSRFIVAALAAVGGAVAAQAAQNYTFDIDNSEVSATPVEQANPGYPDSGIRQGQEGWVRIGFVVTAEGRAIDPIVIDAVGGAGFESSARNAVAEWRFEPGNAESPNNVAELRFEIFRGRDLATSNFLRRYRRIVTHLHQEETEDARRQVDATVELGGWNLYESTMLSLMLGRVDGAEGNAAGKLEHYLRALGVSNRNSLDGEDRRQLLVGLFELQFERGQLAAAERTLRLLRREPGSQADITALAASVDQLQRRLAADEPLRARATIFNPCNCEDGVPLWSYQPSRRTFSFASPSGNVERFEVRCDRDRLQGAVETGKRWSIGEDAGSCRVFVFGDDGATFEFVEHGDAQPDDAAAPGAVARSDVLDRRNRR